eukprot:scaffold56063_cov45-Prasinocladus_malaysianus.AAC.1
MNEIPVQAVMRRIYAIQQKDIQRFTLSESVCYCASSGAPVIRVAETLVTPAIHFIAEGRKRSVPRRVLRV